MMQFINATLCGVYDVIKWTKHSTNFTLYIHIYLHLPHATQKWTEKTTTTAIKIVQNVSASVYACSQMLNMGQNEWHRKIYIQFASFTKMHMAKR